LSVCAKRHGAGERPAIRVVNSLTTPMRSASRHQRPGRSGSVRAFRPSPTIRGERIAAQIDKGRVRGDPEAYHALEDLVTGYSNAIAFETTALGKAAALNTPKTAERAILRSRQSASSRPPATAGLRSRPKLRGVPHRSRRGL